MPCQEYNTQACCFTLATTYSDLTGRYPIISSRGNQYIVIFYNCDTNSIQAIPTNTRDATEIQDATMSMMYKLATGGINKIPTSLIMTHHPYSYMVYLKKNQVPVGYPATT